MKIEKLKSIINKELKSKVDRDYVLLDIPNHQNIGDLLIWQGEREFLKETIFKERYSCSKDLFDSRNIPLKSLILLHGGGNFGDIWPGHQRFREKIISKFKDNKIIILPQTVFFKEDKNIVGAKKAFSSHPDLTICARDLRSYKFLKKNFKRNKILLVPDMAFYLNLVPKGESKSKRRILYILRKDKELTSKFNLDYLENLDIKDWPTLDKTFLNLTIIKLNKIMDKIKFKFINRPKYSIFNNFTNHISKGISFLNKYDLVITNRLHGAILSYLLNIPTILLPNGYNKNKDFYQTWVKDDKSFFFANNETELKSIINENFNWA